MAETKTPSPLIYFAVCTNGQTGRSKRYCIMLLSTSHGGYVVEGDLRTKKEALKRRRAWYCKFRRTGFREIFPALHCIFEALS